MMAGAIEGAIRRVLPARALRLFEGFWTVPLLISLAGAVTALVIDYLPEHIALDIEATVFGRIDPEGGRMALSAIASGVMTVAGLVFSLTFVALSITAQLLSPRILDYVIRQRAMQVLIGFAIATFLFSTITLALVSAEDNWKFTLSVPIALVLAAATLALVIAFAHGMTRVMRIEEMVVRLRDAYLDAIERMIEGPAGVTPAPDDAPARRLDAEFEAAADVCAAAGGYIRHIDHAGLVELSAREGLRICLEVEENDHVLPGMVLARVVGARDHEQAAGEIRIRLAMTDRREVTTGADYEADSLQEAALRALSPGLNDPATALSCVNTLFEGLARIAIRGAPPFRFVDARGELRLAIRPRGICSLIEGSLLPIADAGRSDYRISRRLRDLTAHLETLLTDEEALRCVRAFAVRLEALDRQPDLGAPGAAGPATRAG